MALMQRLMQVATQPSPVKAVFTEADVELAAVVLIQHLTASCCCCSSSQPVASSHQDDVEYYHHNEAASDTAVAMSAAAAAVVSVIDDDYKDQSTLSHSHRRRSRTCATVPVRPPVPAVSQLMEMGFARRKAEAALKQLGTSLNITGAVVVLHTAHISWVHWQIKKGRGPWSWSLIVSTLQCSEDTRLLGITASNSWLQLFNLQQMTSPV